MPKQGVKQGVKTRDTFTVRSFLSQGKTQSQIIALTGFSASKVKRIYRLLKSSNLIQKVGYGTWELNSNIEVPEGVKADMSDLEQTSCPSAVTKRNFWRVHKYEIALQIPALEGWGDRERVLARLRVPVRASGKPVYLPSGELLTGPLHWSPMGGTRGKEQKVEFEGCRVGLSDREVYVHLNRSFFGVDVRLCQREALRVFFGLVRRLEAVFGVCFRFADGYRFQIRKRHVAELGNEFAADRVSRKEALRVRDDLGLWLVVDFSKAEGEPAGPELEYVRARTNFGDSDKVTPWFNGLRALPDDWFEEFTPLYLHGTLSELGKLAGLYAVRLKRLEDKLL